MGTTPRGVWLAAALIATGVLDAGDAGAQQQSLGNRVLGTNGLDAGKEAESGLYVADRFVSYGAYALNDRNGNRVPVNVDLSVLVDAVGVSGVLELKPLATYVSMSLSVPFSSVQNQINNPQASIDSFGLSDIYVQPLRLGWRLPHLDVLAGFAVYVPTGRYEPGGVSNLGAGQWSRELSLGTTVYFDRRKAWSLSALSSYQSNQYKRGIDIRRGDTVQIQGGAGVRIGGTVDLGLDGYALWQVTDDAGADLPPVVRGARDRDFGLGPEVGFVLAPIRSKVAMRYEHDLAAESRPLGQIFVFEFAFTAWKPSK
jgi:hypothetical protein